MEDVLEKINQTPGVEASLIVGKDGLLITSLGDAEPDPDFLGAETAELLQAAEAGMQDKFEKGELGMMSLEAENGHIFLKSINEVTYLMVLTNTDVSLGMVRYTINNASKTLKEQL
ncbi:MAG: roadblock/LC7 domain-containing protein [Candidatus Eremiobacteraeota bacterium]|nr:roadblock/LC7 domain-containing protein [Candidatus Eremiobacteraeota bacterium]